LSTAGLRGARLADLGDHDPELTLETWPCIWFVWHSVGERAASFRYDAPGWLNTNRGREVDRGRRASPTVAVLLQQTWQPSPTTTATNCRQQG
jgi:hypothetical protein